ncbi:MAG TPA: hypothetical protein VKB38_20620 [Terracidiphilus sp.]|nr:hypothetical protein [Terracidiphilus sp.]
MHRAPRLWLSFCAFLIATVSPRAFAQAPDAPAPQPTVEHQTQAPAIPMEQTKRILGVIPNFRAVSADSHLPPQSPKEKFLSTTQDSFDYSAVFIPAALAGYGLARTSVPEFGHGGDAYGEYLWHSAVDQTIENYMVGFVIPVVARQDNRYYTLGHGGFLKRTGYALSRAVVTRSDAGNEVFNVSEMLGSGSSAALSTTYYPASQRDFSSVGSSWALDVGIDALSFVAREFWPDVNHRMFHGAPPQATLSQSTSPQQ